MIHLLRRIGLIALVPAIAGCGGEPPAPTVPVIILGLDTVRADHLGVMGHAEVRTPHLDALAADGVLFTAARTTAPWTGPAFASLFTGLLPYRHGFVGGEYSRLGDEHVTLGEILQEHGYPSEAQVTVKWLTEPFGMDQGWSQVQMHSAEEEYRVTGQGLRFAELHAAEPFLLFLHYFSAHAPYQPPRPYDRMYYDGNPRGGGVPLTQFLEDPTPSAVFPPVNLRIYRWLRGVTDWLYPLKQYAGEVSYLDDQVGQVVARLRELGIYERALIIAVGDHGEHLGEHDSWYTHVLPYEETMRVPLIVKFPDAAHAGQVVPQAVSIHDVLPTILATLGLDAPGELDGRDLTPLIGRADAPPVSAVVAEWGGDEGQYTKAIVDEPWKLHVHHRDGTDIVELYDLSADPWETENLAATQPALVERLMAKLWGLCDGENRLTSAPPAAAGDLTDAEREKLRSLGYTN